MKMNDERRGNLLRVVDVKPLELLNRDMRAKADELRKKRELVGSIRVDGELYAAVESLRKSIATATACSGIYVWTAKAHIGSVIANWQKRMELYRDTTQENKNKNWIKTRSGGKHVEFNLSPLNHQWVVASEELRALTASFTLYVGKREGDKILNRLDQHCKASAQTWALKLSGNTMLNDRVPPGAATDFFNAFKTDDCKLLTGMGFQEIACEIIPMKDLDDGEIKYWESMIRTALIPMIGGE